MVLFVISFNKSFAVSPLYSFLFFCGETAILLIVAYLTLKNSSKLFEKDSNESDSLNYWHCSITGLLRTLSLNSSQLNSRFLNSNFTCTVLGRKKKKLLDFSISVHKDTLNSKINIPQVGTCKLNLFAKSLTKKLQELL